MINYCSDIHTILFIQMLLKYCTNIAPERRGCIDAWRSRSRSEGGSQVQGGQERPAGAEEGAAGGGTLLLCRLLGPGAVGGGVAGREAVGEVGG